MKPEDLTHYDDPRSQEIRAALQALAHQDRDLEAPPAIEAAVLHSFRAARKQQLWKQNAVYVLAAAAGLALAMWLVPRPGLTIAESIPKPLVANTGRLPVPSRQADTHEPDTVGGAEIMPVSLVMDESENGNSSDAAPQRSRRVPRSRPASAVTETGPREIVTEFFPLMDAPPPMERGEIWRISVPASTMRAVGLPVSPDRWMDRVQADVLVGQEGMARAIRFVRYEK